MAWDAAAIVARWPNLSTHTNVPSSAELALIATANISTFLVDVGSAYSATDATHLELLAWLALREVILWYQNQMDYSESMANNAGSGSLPTLRECNFQIKHYTTLAKGTQKKFNFRSG